MLSNVFVFLLFFCGWLMWRLSCYWVCFRVRCVRFREVCWVLGGFFCVLYGGLFGFRVWCVFVIVVLYWGVFENFIHGGSWVFWSLGVVVLY